MFQKQLPACASLLHACKRVWHANTAWELVRLSFCAAALAIPAPFPPPPPARPPSASSSSLFFHPLSSLFCTCRCHSETCHTGHSHQLTPWAPSSPLSHPCPTPIYCCQIHNLKICNNVFRLILYSMSITQHRLHLREMAYVLDVLQLVAVVLQRYAARADG